MNDNPNPAGTENTDATGPHPTRPVIADGIYGAGLPDGAAHDSQVRQEIFALEASAVRPGPHTQAGVSAR